MIVAIAGATYTPHLSRLGLEFRPLTSVPLLQRAPPQAASAAQHFDRVTSASLRWLQVCSSEDNVDHMPRYGRRWLAV